jgi:NTE family protein
VAAVLREAGIPIDLVVGASVGSIFGLGIAAGLPIERLTNLVQAATPLDMLRFYGGRLTPYGSNPIARLLLDAAEGKDFSDLALPFAVVATDMETGRPTVIDRGPVLPAVQASIALPFIARAALLGERYYLDGGLVETMPVRAARDMGAERVIAVSLGRAYRAPELLRRSRWMRTMIEQAARQRSPVCGKLSDQLRFCLRIYTSSYDAAADQPDIAIRPNVYSVPCNSFLGMRLCYRAGIAAAQAALPELQHQISHCELQDKRV